LIIEVLKVVFLFTNALIIAYLVRHYIFTLTVLRRVKKPKNVEFVVDPKSEPTVSILIPARDEESVIRRLLQRMTELTYPRDRLQVIVIDDASSDGTGQIAEEYSRRCGCIEVLHRYKKAGGKGKASALNSGLEHSTSEIVLCFDADYYPQREIVEKLVKEFVDPTVGAVQGRPVVLNEAQNVVTRLVTLERIGGYRVDQEARDNLGLIPQFGGTYGNWRCLPQSEVLLLISTFSKIYRNNQLLIKQCRTKFYFNGL
jgi:cellulose synthase/poly-beta-1,6-N-acetylglucosamine synthase-like glycosyltransferase